MIVMCKLHNCILNLNVNDFFVRASSDIVRGNALKTSRPAYCLTYKQQFFTYKPIALWNKLPDNIVCAKL